MHYLAFKLLRTTPKYMDTGIEKSSVALQWNPTCARPPFYSDAERSLTASDVCDELWVLSASNSSVEVTEVHPSSSGVETVHKRWLNQRGGHVGRKKYKQAYADCKMTELAKTNALGIPESMKARTNLLKERNVLLAFAKGDIKNCRRSSGPGRVYALDSWGTLRAIEVAAETFQQTMQACK